MKLNDKLAAARLVACDRMPYFRAAIMAMVPRKAPGLNTFGVSKHGVLFWDPAALERWEVEETAAVLVHEVSHLLRIHAERQEAISAEPALWNIAADLEINDDIRAAGLELPGEALYPKDEGVPENLTAEEYYGILMKGLEKVRTKLARSGGKGDDGKEEGAPTPGAGSGACGGCAGNPRNGEHTEDQASGRSDLEMTRIRREVAEDIRQSVKSGRGTVPGHWQRWADEQLKPPQVPWRQKLARALRRSIAYRPGAVDYHYKRPSRRQAGIGYGRGKPIMPALYAPVPNVKVIVDTSGSMGSKELVEAASETGGILAAAGADVGFCACDAEVQNIQQVRSLREVLALMHGGGGTDFRPPIEAMIKQRPMPDVVVFITDGQGPAPEVAPPFKLIWVLVGDHRCRPYAGDYNGDHVTYGEFVEIDREEVHT